MVIVEYTRNIRINIDLLHISLCRKPFQIIYFFFATIFFHAFFSALFRDWRCGTSGLGAQQSIKRCCITLHFEERKWGKSPALRTTLVVEEAAAWIGFVLFTSKVYVRLVSILGFIMLFRKSHLFLFALLILLDSSQ